MIQPGQGATIGLFFSLPLGLFSPSVSAQAKQLLGELPPSRPQRA